MATILLRNLKFGLQNFLRNGLVSLTTTVILTLVLDVILLLIMFVSIGQNVLVQFENKIDIAVYFKDSVNESEVLLIQKTIENLPEVKSVEYLSKDKALEIFTKKHENDNVVMRALKELEENPLLASLTIKAKNPNNYKVIAEYLGADSLKEKVEKITYAQNSLIIDRMIKIIKNMKLGGIGLIVFLGIIAGLVIINTVKLVIYSNKNEIEIARLVGASSLSIQGPYIITAIIYGCTSAFLSILISWPLIYFISPYLQNIMPEINLYRYFISNAASLLGYAILSGVALSAISSMLAIKKYTKI